jgi:RNA polymerase-binding transcription factor DksA
LSSRGLARNLPGEFWWRISESFRRLGGEEGEHRAEQLGGALFPESPPSTGIDRRLSALQSVPTDVPTTVRTMNRIANQTENYGPDFLDHQRQLLLEERDRQRHLAERLQADVAELTAERGMSDTDVEDGFGEGAGMVVDRDRDQALHAVARAALDDIEAALARVESGTYGRCTSCGEQIPSARLEAVPAATVCVACKGGTLSRRRAAAAR